MFKKINEILEDPRTTKVAQTVVAISATVLILYVNQKIAEQKVDYIVDRIVQGIEAGTRKG